MPLPAFFLRMFINKFDHRFQKSNTAIFRRAPTATYPSRRPEITNEIFNCHDCAISSIN
jgi:hypothetical protein